MNELLELLETTKNSCAEVSFQLTIIIERCLAEAKCSDNFTIGNILEVSSRIISHYALTTGTIFFNTIDENKVSVLKNVLNDVNLISIAENTEMEFELFCEKAFDVINWYIETIPF